MSSIDIPLGRAASRGGRLCSFSSVARLLGGDKHGLLSSKGHLWPQASSIFGVETASGQPPGKLVWSSSDMMTAAASSEVNAGMVASISIPPCSNGLFPYVSRVYQCVRGLVHLAEQELLHDHTGPLPSWEMQALWVPLAFQ